MRISTSEFGIFLFTLFLAPMLMLGIGNLRHIKQNFRSSNGSIVEKSKELTGTLMLFDVNAQEVIGDRPTYRGYSKGTFTLVEFGDYQCPPCRSLDKIIPKLMAMHPDMLRLTYRNLPLSSIHPRAFSSAIAAEAARKQGKFWQMHDLLMAKALDDNTISTAQRVLGLNATQFRHDSMDSGLLAVKADVTEAGKLGIHRTPSFFLCCPNGKVFHLQNLSALSQFLQ